MHKYFHLFIVLLFSLFVFSCNSRSDLSSMNRDALKILKDKGLENSYKIYNFSVETHANKLRQKIYEDQGLFIPSNASLGLEHLVSVRGEDSAYRDFKESTNQAITYDFSEALTLEEVLVIAAQNNREFQNEKDSVFKSALALDSTRFDFGFPMDSIDFKSTFTENKASSNLSRGIANTLEMGVNKKTISGANFRSSIALDIVQLLKSKSASAFGLVSDSSVTIPLLRGSGKHIAGEPLTKSERAVEYALANFDFFRRNFVVKIAKEYYEILQTVDQIKNAEENYKNLQNSTNRVAAIAESGRMPENQVDQSKQDEYRAKLRLIDAKSRYQDRLDRIKISMGIPVDSKLMLDQKELTDLANQFILPENPIWQENETRLFREAFDNRKDMQVFYRKVEDAQRAVAIAQDGMRAEFTIGGSVSAGDSRGLSTADSSNSTPNFGKGRFQGLIHIDLPLNRKKETKFLRESIINLQQAIRNYQEREDQLKLSLRSAIRSIERVLENYKIQKNSLDLAKRRVERANLLLKAGRIEIRDLLEAQESFVLSQNALTDTVVNFRINQWSLQRDIGKLSLNQFL